MGSLGSRRELPPCFPAWALAFDPVVGACASGVRMSVAVHSCALWLRLLVIAVDRAEFTVVSCNQDWLAIPEI